MGKAEYIRGKAVEKKLAALIAARGTSEKEDMFDHIDLKVELTIDVKGLKRVSRSDAQPNQNIHWVELQNVMGNRGWLYGEADYFAFETEKHFLFVSRETLQEFVKENVKQEFSDRPELFKLYTRNGRKDILTLIPTLELSILSDFSVKK